MGFFTLLRKIFCFHEWRIQLPSPRDKKTSKQKFHCHKCGEYKYE